MIHLVCLGHAKCGTTLLDSVFRQSRLMATPEDVKELKFFLPRGFVKEGARERYLRMFSAAGNSRNFRATFEASPPYSHHPPDVLRETLANITSTLEDPRIIVCFRQPILRAYSHYIHNLHTFALYGEGAFAPARGLLRKPCVMSFEEAFTRTRRLAASYVTTLRLAYEAVGRNRVELFFLERDTPRLEDWIARCVGQEFAIELSPVARGSGTVFGRRPVPNYVLSKGVLHAFGSSPGEHVCYRDPQPQAARVVLDSPKRWTLSLDPSEVVCLTETYYESDLQQCVDLSGEQYFFEYLTAPSSGEEALLSSPSLLRDLHGVDVG